MDSLQSLYNQGLFFISSLTWLGIIDLLLVTVAFYLLLSLIQRSVAAYLLREILVFGLALFILTTLLPLPVFDWLVRGLLLLLLVATPIIFQAQLRHFIERVGRTIGMARALRQGAAENVLPDLIHAVERMADTKTGALIALEGTASLEDVIKTGVPFEGKVTTELLQSIFYPGTPLHDGAVIIHTDKVVASGCVLPLTQRSLSSEKRLGTRHRAAVGLSEDYDALVIIVSEETGYMAVAHKGQLKRPLNSAELREELLDFYDPIEASSASISLRDLLVQGRQQLWDPVSLTNPRRLLSNIGLLLVSLLLALTVWSFVIEQTNPFQRARVENISLRMEGMPENMALIPAPPTSVAAIVQTTEDLLPTLSSRSFQAVVSMKDSTPGLYRLPVRVNSGPKQVLVLATDPPILDLELAPVISRTIPVIIEIRDQQALSPAYEMVGAPTAYPAQLQVTGPAPLVEQVNKIETSISLASTNSSGREMRPVRALDEQGREVSGLNLQPAQVQVNTFIRKRTNARDVSVRAVINGPPPPDYWLRNLTVAPVGVTLQGNPDQLAEADSFVDTLPVDVTETTGDLSLQVPLDLPPDIKALDSNGNTIEVVTVSAQVAARSGDLMTSRPVELIQATSGSTATVTPAQVDLLLSGPLPVLNEIEKDSDLVRVLLEPAELQAGQTTELKPEVVAPPGIRVQLVPSSVLVTYQ